MCTNLEWVLECLGEPILVLAVPSSDLDINETSLADCMYGTL